MPAEFLHNLFALCLEAAPWLLLGLVVAGLLKAWLPEGLLQRKLGQGRLLPVIKASLIGAPLPLCSCGVLPAAMGLRRSGAPKSATVSFMISTPETGPDSIALTYALMGPFMALVRPVAAILSAISTGLLNAFFVAEDKPHRSIPLPVAATTASCACDCSDCCTPITATEDGFWRRGMNGLRYAFREILDDIWLWLVTGLVLAALVMSYVPPESLVDWGDGLPAMLLMLLVGIPMYICATASTPLAAAIMLAGISPGTVLVFLLAGPATNLATMGILKREMGAKTLLFYLLGISVSSILLGLATNALILTLGIDIRVRPAAVASDASRWIEYLCGLVLMLFTLSSLKRSLQARVNAWGFRA